jgi:hypothetical protein
MYLGSCCAAGALALGEPDLDAALAGFSPASAWGVGRASSGGAAGGPGPRGWEDVGGLEDVREALQETLQLPARYARLLARCAGLRGFRVFRVLRGRVRLHRVSPVEVLDLACNYASQPYRTALIH